MKINSILLAAILGVMATTAYAQGDAPQAVKHMLLPDLSVADSSRFNEDKESYGNYLASALSAEFYPSARATITLFRSRSHRNGTASYKFNQVIGDHPVVHGDIVLSTDINGEIFYIRGPVLNLESALSKLQAPSDSLVKTLSRSMGVNSYLIEHQSSCYFYQESKDQLHPAHVFLVDALFGTTPDSVKIIANAETGEILEEIPLMIPAKYREIYDNNNTTTMPANPSRVEGQGPVGIADVDNTYVSSGLVYDLFNTRFGRDSWDDNGGMGVHGKSVSPRV